MSSNTERALSDAQTDAAAVALMALAAAEPERLEPGTIYGVADGDGRVRVADTDLYAEHPRRAVAVRVVYDAASFARYLSRHQTRDSEVFADVQTARVVGVIDSHSPAAHNEPGWQEHAIRLELTKSPAWKAWEARDGQLMPQAEFAQLIELQASDVVNPSATDLLDLAQTFQAQKGVDYVSSERLLDGQIRLRYEETVTAKAGQKGDIDIPARIELAVRPYIGAPAYRVGARFRYRIDREQHLSLGYVLERPHLVLEAAFGDVVDALRRGSDETEAGAGDEVPAVTAPIYQGRP